VTVVYDVFPGGYCMEKKIARICRWLDRCAKACSAGSWSSALLDMECAKAELDEARTELWARSESASSGETVRRTALVLKISCLSMVFILALAAPLAIQGVSPVRRSEEFALEWVTSDEKAVLSALRKSLSEANRAWLADTRTGREVAERPETNDVASLVPEGHAEKVSREARPEYSGTGGTRTRVVSPGKDRSPRQKEEVSAGRELDEIITLVQIGQKALRERESPIEFHRP